MNDKYNNNLLLVIPTLLYFQLILLRRQGTFGQPSHFRSRSKKLQPFQLRVVLKVQCSKLKNEVRSLNNKKWLKYKNAYISLFFFFLFISSAIKLSLESSLTCLKSKKCRTVNYINCQGMHVLARVYTGHRYPVYPPPKKKKQSILTYTSLQGQFIPHQLQFSWISSTFGNLCQVNNVEYNPCLCLASLFLNSEQK